MSDVDVFNLTQQTQQLGLAAAVHDLADMTARQTALLDLQLIGIDLSLIHICYADNPVVTVYADANNEVLDRNAASYMGDWP